MRVTTTILLLFSLTKSYSQGILGAGLVEINFDERTIIDFYKTPTDKIPYKSIEFRYEVETDSWTIENLDNEIKWLKPEMLELNDSKSVFFRCKSRTTDWLELVVNNERGATLWVRQSRLTKFVTWEEYLKGMLVISRIKVEKQKIRKLPNNTSDEIKYDGGDFFQVKKLTEEWIEIFTPDDCNVKYTKGKIESGWIKWREGNKLLIDYYKSS